MGIIARVQQTSHRIGRHLDSVLVASGVDQAEAHVLAALAGGPMSVAALVEAVAVKRSTLTNILDRLERRGLVRREINPRDRRSFVVRPTRGGERAARKIAAAFSAVDAKLARTTTAEERQGFEAVIARLEEIL